MTRSISELRLQLERIAGNGPRTISIAQARQELDRSVRNTPRPTLSREAQYAGLRRAIAYRKQELEAARHGLKAMPGTARREVAVANERRGDTGPFTAAQKRIIEGRKAMYTAMHESRAVETR